MAGLWSAGGPNIAEFLALHISGGTTELLGVRRNQGGFSEKTLGSTADLHAGQFIDRVGVALGLPFPAGPALEALARAGTPGRVTLSASVKGLRLSFSGPESQAQRLIGQVEAADLALAVLACVSKSLEGILRRAVEETGRNDVLVVGGVAANHYLRERLRRRLEHRAVGARLYFAEPRYSTDNAVGVALLARDRLSLQ
jgi:N6-L-threonylcarbamoyladenine synthase